MKEFNRNNKSFSLFHALVLVLVIGLSGCTGWDDFREYTEDGEIIYPGKVIKMETFSGDNRVKIMGKLGPDARVKTLRIFWNDYADSLELEATNEMRTTGFEQFIEVSEGLRTFIIHTYDEVENRSLAVSEIGISYGTNYRAKIKNKAVSSIYKTDSSTFVIWKPIDLSTGAKYTTVYYEVDGVQKVVDKAASSDSTELKGLIKTTPIEFETVYLPSSNCIDYFYTDKTAYTVTR